MFFSVIINTYKRYKDLNEAIDSVFKQKGDFEIIIIDNDPASTAKNILPKSDKISYYKQEKNLGVAGGRNAGIKLAQGDIFVFLDDDAIFETDDIFTKIENYFKKYNDVACLAFRIENYFTRNILPKEFPHPDMRLVNKSMYVSYFLGGASAMKKNVIKATGPFLDLMYWGEELELSFRIIKLGHKILYTPNIVVLHKANPSGRFADKKLIYYSLRNRFFALAPHLPLRYLIVNLSTWSLIWFYKALKQNAMREYTKAIFHGTKQSVRIFKKNRTVIKGKALKYLMNNGGRLWF